MDRKDRQNIAFLLLILSGTVLALTLLATFRFVPVNPDAGYYIPIAREVLNGGTPTADVKTLYPPGIYYVYAAWMRFAGTEFSLILLLNYLTHAGNAFLVFLAIIRQTRSIAVAVVLALTSLFSVFAAEGYTIGIEPFQVFFALLAYHLYLSPARSSWTYALMGMLLGCSLMMKQYSVLILTGFMINILWDTDRKGRRGPALSLLFLVCALVPFLSFLAFTDASLVSSLRAFGFLGTSAISYAAMQPDIASVVMEILRESLHFNWLVLPVLFVWFIAGTPREIRPSLRSLTVLFLLCLLPVLIRRFGHYFQLIVPWSCLLWAFLADDSLRRLRRKGRDLTGLLCGALVCLVIVVPLFMFMTPPFSRDLPYWDMALIASVFLILTLLILGAGLSVTSRPLCRDSAALLLTALLVMESLFFCTKVPFSKLANEKVHQAMEAQEIGKVLPRGEMVYILLAPHLYVTCGFLNPLRDYTFAEHFTSDYQWIESTDWGKVKTIIQKADRTVIPGDVLKRLGYTESDDLSGSGYRLFRKDPSQQ